MAEAEAVFTAAGMTPLEAANAATTRLSWDITGFPPDEEPGNAVLNASFVFDEARDAAMRAVTSTPRHQMGRA